ncbi:MAG: TIGR03752 family integrating conjugative element protein [Methylococcaceae bacterium]|nr:TIGR03752 family integrating conjugative element protein [Methylococcaceae bacterium]
MASNKSSMVLPMFVIALLATAGGIIYFLTQVGLSDGKGGKQTYEYANGTIKVVTADADNATDTLNTIAINSADIRDKFTGVDETINLQQKQMLELTSTLKEFKDSNDALQRKLEIQNRKMEAMQEEVKQGNTIDAESIKTSILEGLKTNISDYLPNVPSMPSMPDSNYTITENIKNKKETRTRIRSYGVPMDEKGNISPEYIKSLNDDDTNDEVKTTDGGNQAQVVVVDPRFTIPTDAVLNDSITVTALVGRIPRDGDVNDPSPFKVAIGRDNLAANGFRIPGIDGMIMSGFVYGDSVRKCVRTKITRATYIFEDGRILTLPKKKSKGDILGYLTDPYGDPCIKGRFYSNGNSQLTKSILANMAAGAANAYAETQTTTISNSNGSTSKFVSGDNKKFIMGSAISSGANSVASMLANQQFDQWDQVVVDVGKTVIIHMDVALEIDNTSQLRKLVYENGNSDYGLTD